ncbi:hypothetical protein K458DRAFT_323085 [Lentithecium fluviatile CBS 122367]|uniref:Apple domain-containing protein n=1 Tax=Lentithecium fluviatile CBS 122367 TaxID=1168545 RepID=A0A6G1ICZ8_9PLEO|nr:hypothetical protein K458DRAFT_323085 [Lentithecium fluviatile CBS 122367]
MPLKEQPDCTLEPVPKSETHSYIYSVPERSLPYLVENAPTPIRPYAPQQAPRTRNWTRWPFLLTYGVLIAVIAGMAGGFIGKKIGGTQHNTTQEIAVAPSRTTPTIPATASGSPFPTSSSATFERIIPVPVTGCNPKTEQKSHRSFTANFDVPYTTFCNTGWLQDELIAGSFATPSDCIEACQMYNSQRTASDRECVGGGFIPEWWNQTKAMAESGGMPYNCFLKSNTSKIGTNDRDIEVVALCLEGQCDDVLG